jgi:ATP-dependent Lon protease
MATAIISLFTETPVRRDVAMTGEITLRGRVLPVGGLREKILAAVRAGIKDVVVPQANEPDLREIPAQLKDKARIHLARELEDVLEVALVGFKPKRPRRVPTAKKARPAQVGLA